jgi:hypothetical protein
LKKIWELIYLTDKKALRITHFGRVENWLL